MLSFITAAASTSPGGNDINLTGVSPSIGGPYSASEASRVALMTAALSSSVRTKTRFPKLRSMRDTDAAPGGPSFSVGGTVIKHGYPVTIPMHFERKLFVNRQSRTRKRLLLPGQQASPYRLFPTRRIRSAHPCPSPLSLDQLSPQDEPIAPCYFG